MARVFVSHASKDGACAGWLNQLHQWLVDERHEVFLDQNPWNGITLGGKWEEWLYERLRWADAVVCVVTSAYRKSEWCSAEVGIAMSRGSRVLPVLAEPGVADHPLLTSLHHADLLRDPIAARALLVEKLRRVDAVGGWGWPDNRSPFPGLRPLDVQDHQVFFGRRREVEQLAKLLRPPAERAEAAVLMVVGPSGCGKSSLVRAGLVHVIANEADWWTLNPILPGSDPVGALARELAVAARKLGRDWTVADVKRQLEDDGLRGRVDELLRVARARRLLMVVDQFEELLTQATPAARAQFAQLLHAALGSSVQVVTTLRPEFLNQLLSDLDLA
ncbi:MAG: toll/interleukin-1 receptor domain-containing protein, partial [Pseudonocardiaceae bacterium]